MRPYSNLGRPTRYRLAALAVSLCAIAAPSCSAQGAPQATAQAEPPAMAHGLFSGIRVYRPIAGARQFVMLVTDDASPTGREEQMLRTMLEEGAMVATVPFALFYPKLVAQDGKCTYGPGAFENQSRHLQAFEHLPGYL